LVRVGAGWCRLAPGDRVLLAAESAYGLLVVHPPAALGAMVDNRQAARENGDNDPVNLWSGQAAPLTITLGARGTSNRCYDRRWRRSYAVPP
jgi:hypothetical protein